MTITAAMTAKQCYQENPVVKLGMSDLWSVMNIYGCNYWFLGVEQATELTESYQEPEECNQGENFAAQIKV